jgi:hypothetical protein
MMIGTSRPFRLEMMQDMSSEEEGPVAWWDYPRLPRIQISRFKWARRFWLAIPHKRQPYLSLSGKPITSGSILKDSCRRCGRQAR